MSLHRVMRIALLILVVLGCSPSLDAAVAQGGVPDDAATIDLATPFLREAAAVVSITAISSASCMDSATSEEDLSLPLQSFEPTRRARQRAQSSAWQRGVSSGLIVGSHGEIVTNAHAVCDVDRATVRLADGRQFQARVMGLDRATDIALLKIDARALPTAAIAVGGRPAAGDWVLAIGSPFGLENSVTAGIISAPQRHLHGSPVPLIQSDVAINPGSSGGPLLNLRGEVIGLNSMVFSLSGGYMGVSFAVPIDIAMKVVDELRSHGRVSRGQLGAKVQALTPDLARSFGLPSARGAIVLHVTPRGPAERGGLRSGDVVLGTDGASDATFDQLQQQVFEARPRQRLVFTVWRHGAMQRLELITGEAPADLPMHDDTPEALDESRLGMNLAEMPASRRARTGLDAGLPVLESSGAASRGGVERDDVIVAVGDRPVRSVADFDSALAAVPRDRPVALLVLRGRVFAYLAVDRTP